MFRKKCARCNRKINKEYDFCPYCGYNVKKEDEANYGLLGKSDELDFPDIGIRMPLGFDKLFSSLLNQIDKQSRELDREIGKDIKKDKKMKASGISISISTGTGKKPEIRVGGFGPEFKELRKVQEKRKVRLPKTEISEERARKLAKLPKEEAKTEVRRLSNKIVYEIMLPGVKSLKDIIINQLENSIEIKAFSKNKAYFKLLPLSLPILNYKLNKEKLILELKAKD